MTTRRLHPAPPCARPFRWLAPSLLVVAIGACGDGDPAPDDGRAASGRESPAAMDAGSDTTREPSGTDTSGPPPSEAADQEGPGPWSDPPLRRVPEGSQRGVALLRSVRSGRHEGYDRIVFEFEDHLPEYTIRYMQDPTACGSGHRVDAGAAAALEVDLRPAAAHDDQGQPTITERVSSPGLPALRTARITCDFEAIVTWVLGLDRRTPIRALELGSPPRLVVDIPHR